MRDANNATDWIVGETIGINRRQAQTNRASENTVIARTRVDDRVLVEKWRRSVASWLVRRAERRDMMTYDVQTSV